ncbi:MAG: HvfA family oxazolone/thioamide-modified RiPP metallophore, partial [Gammaproteobacteria bacterium]
MSKKNEITPLSIAVGAALAASAFTMTAANAESNPFEINTLSSGYMVAENDAEGKCGEGKCGGD